jgi:lycopene beta-cyclase
LSVDLLIVGSGPAGRALAAEASDRGLDVLVVDPGLHRPWTQTYGAWVDELPEGAFGRTWERAQAAGRLLHRPYGLVDSRALRDLLHREAVRGRAERVLSVEEDGEGFRVRTDLGEVVAARVVDASGHRPAALERPEVGPLGWQTAFGWLLEVEAHPFDLEEMVFMDLSGPSQPLPSFLYAMPMGPRLLFVEETSLIAAVSPTFELLRGRLEARLDRMGVRGRVLETERCRFPMGAPLPPPQPVLGLGASAGMVHPATGYSLGSSLRGAAELARGLELGLDSAALWARMWSPARLRSRALHTFGAQALLDLDQAGLSRFFESFFALPEPLWRDVLDIDVRPGRLALAMARLFTVADSGSRRELITTSLSESGLGLARSLIRTGVR